MAGFIFENGAVTRGICEINEEGYLTAVHETSNIVKTPEGAAVDNDGHQLCRTLYWIVKRNFPINWIW